MPRTIIHLLWVTVLAASVCPAQDLEVDLVIEKVIHERLEMGAVKMKLRQATIAGLFTESGCKVEEQAINKRAANVICTLPGETASLIVIGGHFDFIEKGKGIVDNWSGTSLLPSLYDALKSRPRKHTYIFVATADEERGLIGATRFVKKLTAEQKQNFFAFINLECLGLNIPKVWLSRADRSLVERLLEISNTLKIPVEAMNIGGGADDDSHPFANAKLPVITVHSLSQDKMPILHSDRDKLSAIDIPIYYSTYKLLAFYLAYLDIKLP